MTHDEIVKLMHKAGVSPNLGMHRFAQLVIQAEREVCDERGKGWLEVKNARTIDEGCMHAAAKAEAIALAAAIRARGER